MAPDEASTLIEAQRLDRQKYALAEAEKLAARVRAQYGTAPSEYQRRMIALEIKSQYQKLLYPTLTREEQRAVDSYRAEQYRAGTWALWVGRWLGTFDRWGDWLKSPGVGARFVTFTGDMEVLNARAPGIDDAAVPSDAPGYPLYALLWSASLPVARYKAYVLATIRAGDPTGFVTPALDALLRAEVNAIPEGSGLLQIIEGGGLRAIAYLHFNQKNFSVEDQRALTVIGKHWLLADMLRGIDGDLMIAEPPSYNPSAGDNVWRIAYNYDLYCRAVVSQYENKMSGASVVPVMPLYVDGYKRDKTFQHFVFIGAAALSLGAGIAMAGGVKAFAGKLLGNLLKPLTRPIATAGHFIGAPNVATFALETGETLAVELAAREVGAFASPVVRAVLTGDVAGQDWLQATENETRAQIKGGLIAGGVPAGIAGRIAAEAELENLPDALTDASVTLPDLADIDLSLPVIDTPSLPPLDVTGLALKLPGMSLPDVSLPDIPSLPPALPEPVPADAGARTVVISERRPGVGWLLALAALAALAT